MIKLNYHAVHDEVQRLAKQARGADYAHSDDISDHFKYDVAVVRPKVVYLPGSDDTGTARVFNCSDKRGSLSAFERALSQAAIRLWSNSPHWLDYDDIVKYNMHHSDARPSVVLYDRALTHAVSAQRADGVKCKLINLCYVKNVDELTSRGVLPQLQPEQEPAWQHDVRFDALLVKRLRVNVLEYGSCSTPFVMRTAQVELDRFGDNVANIYMPPSHAFASRENYYDSLFHELSHIMIMRGGYLGTNYDQNEVAAQLSARVLVGLFEHKEPCLDRFSTNYVISYGIKQLNTKELDDTLRACANAILDVRAAVPEIDKYDRDGNPVRYHHSTVLQQKAKLRGEYLKVAMPEIKHQMSPQQLESLQQAKQALLAKLALQAKQHKHNRPSVADNKLQQPKPKPSSALPRTSPSSASKGQIKTKASPEPSKNRDFER